MANLELFAFMLIFKENCEFVGYIYDLDEPYYLYEDVQDLLESISEYYDCKKVEGLVKTTVIYSLPKEVNKFSNKATELFNRLFVNHKKITLIMYALIEGIMMAKYGEFNKIKLQEEIQGIKYIRLLNNKIKHHKNKGVKIVVIMKLMINPDMVNVGCWLDFRTNPDETGNLVHYESLISAFMIFLEREKIVEICS